MGAKCGAVQIPHHRMRKIIHTRKRPLRLGFVALADCAPVVMAGELGLFAKYGIDVELHREVGWATIRDKIIYGELAPRHPEKVLMVRRDFAERSEREHLALIAALIEACAFCQQPENRERLMEALAQPEFVGVPIQALRMGMAGTFDYGHGRIEKHPAFHLFSGEGVNAPTPDKADWVIRNLLASGLVKDPQLVAAERGSEWFRTDIFATASNLVTTNTHETNNDHHSEPHPSPLSLDNRKRGGTRRFVRRSA